jgi:hypothetical protein
MSKEIDNKERQETIEQAINRMEWEGGVHIPQIPIIRIPNNSIIFKDYVKTPDKTNI